MNFMVPHGIGVDFTWALTIGVVIYSFFAFAGYLIYSVMAKRPAKHSELSQEGKPHERD
jgi:hypothetical protein